MTKTSASTPPAPSRDHASLIPKIAEAGILLVEDNPFNMMMLEEILRSGGFSNIQKAEDGEAALKILQYFTPTLMIIDLMMPGMDGFTLCRKLREDPQFQNLPILVQTGLEDETQRLSIFEIGANDLVTKPFNPDELLARTETHIEKHLMLRELQDYKRQMQDDLSNARELQNMLMPTAGTLQHITRQTGLDIAALFEPSRVIGGDCWGMKYVESAQKIILYFGDFTGHGITSAINVFRLKTLLDRLDETVLLEPDLCLTELNRMFHAMLPTELYMVMFYGVLDLNRNMLDYAAAGCPAPIRLPAGAKLNGYEELNSRGIPVAAQANTSYESRSIPFAEGDTLLLYSDALIESPNLAGDVLEMEDILKALEPVNQPQTNATKLLNRIVQQFRDHTNKTTVEDDLTITVFKRLGVLR